MVLYRVLKQLIEKGQIDGIDEKLDVFYTINKITKEQYEELCGILAQELES